MSNDFYLKLGAKIYSLRRKLGLSREKFAELAGMNDYYLEEIEKKKNASLDIVFKIASILNIKTHELLNVE